MSIQWMDFPSGDTGIYGSGSTGRTNALNGTPWVYLPSGALTEDPDPLVTGTVLTVEDDGGTDPWGFGPRLALPSPTTTPGFAGRFWFPSFGSVNGDRNYIGFRNSGNSAGFWIRTELNGGITVLRDSTVLGELLSPVLTTDAWQHISFTINTVSGEWSVQREGIPLLSGTDSVPPSTTMYFWAATKRTGSTGAGTYQVKDFIVYDQSGTVNNTHPGPVGVYRLTPNGDVSSGWSKSSGSTDYELVDETPPSDTDYISAGEGPLPAPSIMTLSDLDPDIVAIRGVMTVVRARKTDGGDAKLQVSLSPDGVDWDAGADRAITTAATYWSDLSELSPDTGVPWTPVEINNAVIKLDRTL